MKNFKYLKLFFLVLINITCLFITVFSQEKKEDLENQKTETKKVPVHFVGEQGTYFSKIKILNAKQGIYLKFKNTEVWADFVEVRDKQNYLYAYGNLKVLQDVVDKKGKKLKRKINGKYIKLNYDKNSGVIYDADGISEPFYFKSGELEFSETEENIFNTSASTCNKEKPHYFMQAKQIKIYPDKKVVAKNISFFVGKTKLFNFPVYVASLKEKKRQPFAPDIGYNIYDGFYIKTTYSYILGGAIVGSLMLDYLQKKGIGKGLEQSFKWKKGSGGISLYNFNKKNSQQTNLISNLFLNQNISKNEKISTTFNYNNERTSFLQEIRTYRNNFTYTYSGKKSSTNLTVNNSYIGGLSNQQNLQANLTNNWRFNNLNISNNITFFSFKLPNNPSNEEMNVALNASKYFPKFSVSLLYQRRFDPDGNKYTLDDYAGIYKTPEININVNKINLPLMSKNFNNKLNLMGNFLFVHYEEKPKGKTLEKESINLSANPSFNFNKITSLNNNLRFTQDFYSNNFARYLMSATSSLSIGQNIGWQWQTSYNWASFKGPTPFSFEGTGKIKNVTTSLFYHTKKKFTFQSFTGYDFKTRQYQPLSNKFKIIFSPSFTTDLNFDYDLNFHKAGYLYGILTENKKNVLDMQQNFRYSVLLGKLQQIDNSAKINIGKFYYLEVKQSYDAINKKFLYNDFLLKRDLHCWEAQFSYKQITKEFSVLMFIKAFPTSSVKLGVDEKGVNYNTNFLNF